MYAKIYFQFPETFISGNGDVISWDIIKKLHKLQEHEGLNCGNKLTSRHIMFWQQKMKVSLSVQTLSSSVADSIKFCREILSHPDFENSQGTEEFIRLMDILFDVLNTSSPLGKGYKGPINLQRKVDTLKFLHHAKNYILGLKNRNGEPLIKTQRNIAFIGLLIDIDALEYLICFKIKTYKWKYILTYKFSQDHIELLFNAIRRAGKTELMF